uniref:N/A n=1 Tax=Ganoderma boninense TaxID=34458 RepID=A0A5K1K0P9_9APHY|nr:N/A [Ganoderma boninense]
MNFYVPIGSDEPYQYVFAPPDGVAHNNLGSETHPVVVHDVRGREAEYFLDKNGFQFVRWPTTEKAFTDPEAIKTKYYAEVEALLKSVTGGKRVVIFDHTIRSTAVTVVPGPRRSAVTETLDNLGARGPVVRIKPLEPSESCHSRARGLTTARPRCRSTSTSTRPPQRASRASTDTSSRVRIINVWRPIAHPVAHAPLALADWRTLPRAGTSLVSMKLVYPDRVGSTFSVRYSPGIRFHYLADQRPEEVALIKIFDSEEQAGRARQCAHSAFRDSGSPPDAPTRQSIEVRAIVFDEE